VAATSASPLAVLGSGSLAAYWRFHRAVAKAQLAAWLRVPRKLLVDVSGPFGNGAALAAAAGHTVVRVIPAPLGAPPDGAAFSPPAPWHPVLAPWAAGAWLGRPDGARPDGDRAEGGWAGGAGGARRRGEIVPVMAEPGSLAFLADGCADGVIAEDGALSRCLMTEDMAAEIARVLRPGGDLLACVDSLVLGMAILAEQHHWAHLVDLPRAEVVLIPWPDGTITRCFGIAQLKDLLTEAGLDVTWIRPRTVLSPSMVDHVLRREPAAMARLVGAELRAGHSHLDSAASEESFGIRLLAAARKRPAPRG
jgi:hypothetical protein